MTAVDGLLSGLPGTTHFHPRSFFWGFILCLSTAVIFQLMRQSLNELAPLDTYYKIAYQQRADTVGPAVPCPVEEGGAPRSSCKSWIARTQNEDPWRAMKLIGRPSACRVKGNAIEELEPDNNFRRAYTLGFVDYVEDKAFLMPWLLASKDTSLGERKRRVYLDLGANAFKTSVTWFLREYPLDFTEIHAFERVEGRFQIPDAATSNGDLSPISSASRKRKTKAGPLPIPPWQLRRIKAYNQYVGIKDDPAKHVINITRFMKEQLGLTADDTVIVKMDIESAEWDILPVWLKDPEMPRIIDELFVEVHYRHPSMRSFGWHMFSHTRDEATQLLTSLRAAGFYAHPWP